MTVKSIAANQYPEGLPGLLTMKEFCALIGVSRPTGLSIVRTYPSYTVKRGNTQLVSVGLYQLLTHDESTESLILSAGLEESKEVCDGCC